mmetsp:Transcript_60345/g.111952  ORF Transcript_60345/g.111952 Transcript_60345/m.111952 type:complete len:316 (+) Transcript_60345:43-990(+)
MGLEILVLLVPLLAAASYTLSVYQGLQPNFNEMRLLAAPRRPTSVAKVDEDIRTLLEEIGLKEGDTLRELTAPEDGWQQVHPADTTHTRQAKLVFAGDCVRVGRCEDGSFCIHAKSPVDEPVDLRELLDILPSSGIVQDITRRQLWHAAIDENDEVDKLEDLAGDWEFCFRDYVNSEELAGLVAASGAFSPISLAGRSKLFVANAPDDKTAAIAATLRDTLMLFGVVPLKIQWSGSLTASPSSNGGSVAVIDWASSEAEVGWPWLGRKIDRPPAAEKLRQEPWEVTALKRPRGSPEVMVLSRRNVGKLAFQALRR